MGRWPRREVGTPSGLGKVLEEARRECGKTSGLTVMPHVD